MMSEPDGRELVAEAIAPGCPEATGPWVERPGRLRFRLGEMGLGSVTLPALVLDRHFLQAGVAAEPALPFERFPRGIEVAIAPSYPVPERLPPVTTLGRVIRYVPAQYRRHYVDLAGSFDAYLDKFSSKSRATLRKKVRKFAEFSGGEIRWWAFRREEVEDFYRLAFEVSRKTYQARLLKAGLADIDEFRRGLERCDDARGYILSHEDRPVAYIFCPVQGGNLLYRNVGYDPEYQQWSPGTVLQYLALESAFAECRFRTFDFTEGEGAHKEFFANRDVLCADLFYFRRTPRNALLVRLHSGLNGASEGAGRLLDRVGLKSRIKKLIRSTS